MKPTERSAIARVPASGPGPNTATNSSAQTREFTEREVTNTNLANRFSARLGATLRAAISPIGTAIAMAIRVPSVAMWSVSTSARSVGPT